MTYRGRVHNGVVVLPEGVTLPDALALLHDGASPDCQAK